jgi:hypothetical protein
MGAKFCEDLLSIFFYISHCPHCSLTIFECRLSTMIFPFPFPRTRPINFIFETKDSFSKRCSRKTGKCLEIFSDNRELSSLSLSLTHTHTRTRTHLIKPHWIDLWCHWCLSQHILLYPFFLSFFFFFFFSYLLFFFLCGMFSSLFSLYNFQNHSRDLREVLAVMVLETRPRPEHF